MVKEVELCRVAGEVATRIEVPPEGKLVVRLNEAQSPPHDSIDDLRTLRTIRKRHIDRVDKHYRMRAGLASVLTGYTAGMLGIEIRVYKRWRKPLNETAQEIARNWRAEPELQNARSYRVWIYKATHPVGFWIPAQELNLRMVYELARHVKDPQPDILLADVSGLF